MEIPCPQAPGYGNPAALYSSGNALEDPSQFTMLELLEAARRRGGADYVDQLVRDVEKLAIDRDEDSDSESEASNEARSEPAVRALDKISVAGAVRLWDLREHAAKLELHVLVDLIDIVAHERIPHLWNEIKRPKEGASRPVKKCYHAHLQELEDAKVIARCLPHERPRFTSGYFEVPKSETESRAIFNGKRLSEATPVPPPVNLADTRTLVEELKRFFGERKKGGTGKLRRGFIWLGDFRHWFHQIQMHPSRWKWFGVRCSNELMYLWRMLPMGWSWSPAIAQAVAWAVLCAHPDAEEIFDLSPFREKNGRLPTFLRIRTGGFVTVYYDNFFVIADRPEVRDRIMAGCKAAFARYNAIVKEGSEAIRDMPSIQATGFEYLGIQLRIHDKDLERHLELRPAKLPKWLPPPAQMTLREAAIYAGRGVFCGLLRGRAHLQNEFQRETVRLARRLGKAAHQDGWDSIVTSPHIISLVKAVWQRTIDLKREPIRLEVGKIIGEKEKAKLGKQLVLATDACLAGLGWCIFTEQATGKEVTLHSVFDSWSKDGLSEPPSIYVNEALAVQRAFACESTRRILDSSSHPVKLVVDNAGLAYALRNGATTSDRVQSIIDSLENVLHRLDVILVVTEDNPSDVQSRTAVDTRPAQVRRADFEQRTNNLARALQARAEGWSWASTPLKQWFATKRSETGSRHDIEA